MAGGGSSPIRTSRRIPPVLAAANESTSTPNRSSRCFTPAAAPLSAKTNVPLRSSMSLSTLVIVRSTQYLVPGQTLGSEASDGARLGLGGLFFPAARWRAGLERVQQSAGDLGNFLNRAVERGFVGLGGLVEAADFSHKLERGGANFVFSNGRREIKQVFDISAHKSSSWFLVSSREYCRA